MYIYICMYIYIYIQYGANLWLWGQPSCINLSHRMWDIQLRQARVCVFSMRSLVSMLLPRGLPGLLLLPCEVRAILIRSMVDNLSFRSMGAINRSHHGHFSELTDLSTCVWCLEQVFVIMFGTGVCETNTSCLEQVFVIMFGTYNCNPWCKQFVFVWCLEQATTKAASQSGLVQPVWWWS